MLDNIKNIRSLAFLVFYFIVTNAVIFFLPIEFFSIPHVDPINKVEYVESSSPKPPQSLNIPWQSIGLPDLWIDNHKDSDAIWYRTYARIDKTEDDIWAIYLPSLTHNAVVYINGNWVGQGGKFETPISRHHNEPLLFKFSSSLLNDELNRIDVRVQAAFYTQGLFDQFYLAPAKLLQNAYDLKHFVRVDFIQWLTIFMLVAAAIIFLFWVARPQDTVYGYFAALLFLWAIHNLNLFINNIPVSEKIWEAITMCTLGWTVVVMIFFIHRYVGVINLKVEKILLIFSVLGIGIFFLPDIGSILSIGYGIWDFFLIIFGMYALYFLMHSYLYHNSFDAYLIMLVGALIISLGLHDILLVNHFIDRREGLTIQFSIIPTVILFSWFLVRRFLQSINNAEMLAATLERRVEEKQLSLEKQYKQLNEFENQSVLTKERERIMRDMHDGIGGQLVSIATLLSGEHDKILIKIREKIHTSINDLRFVIDSLDPCLNDLPTLLGTMRMRISEQLTAENIKLEWGITDLPDTEALTPSQSLHIMRIVQEAVMNSIKHSGTKKVVLTTAFDEVENTSPCLLNVYVEIIDFGNGNLKLNDALPHQGRGLTNMQYRAEQLNAELELTFLKSGSKVRLILKMEKK